MGMGKIAHLADRGVVRVGGPEARGFLQNLLTCDLDRIEENGAGTGALLTPQGKILFGFLIFRQGEDYLLDLPRAAAGDLVKRLTFYRLRSKVEIADISAETAVLALWGGEVTAPDSALAHGADPRLATLGQRAVVPASGDGSPFAETTADAAAYRRHRIALGVPEAPFDFAYGDVFPHDVDMDDLNGVAFDKGCFIGQEVVSRMQHRGTARRRIVKVTSDTALPASGSTIEAGGKPVGTLGSVDGTRGLALVRLDRVAAAQAAGTTVAADGVALRFALPEFARFTWPETASADD
ncbi:CAF17-like 4Fe-4S cluster assembly/insertion protein YgfZ [Stappia indica]|uniref:CAF17-like 4Fe-4S cluster assembly/insertion protein YgfZ n=1 Tax=Stappia indica TaxID=538381 RepID=UPI001CD818A6|nr:folate-binding protein YgfZ [Stappia indica]MCA1297839.1 folate-binding protein YgfZ [Stappia indica]